ncbi:hypothetical protein HS088_TW18G00875 [Tripterygium wilfordii]|uniref:Uncharacterized protein n=1 Tax=Tripterygium wilfordii TaxID=458696 RepID=A0A7J7CDD9_TRIWF|nr:hypothetical protein HS088_TW18G00875 [Tripterygium wilfordii]
MAFDNYKDVSSITPSGEDVPDSVVKALTCVNICLKSESAPALFSVKNADILQVSGLLNTSEKSPETSAPVAACIPGFTLSCWQSEAFNTCIMLSEELALAITENYHTGGLEDV